MLEWLLNDLWLWAPVLLGISFGMDRQSNQQQQEQGLPVGQRQLFGNTGLGVSGLLDPLYRNLLTSAGQPLGFGIDTRPEMQGGTGGWLNLGQNVSGMGLDTTNLPNLTASGLFPQQQNLYDTAFQQAVRQAFGQQSGQYAQSGFNNPEAIGAIAGSVAQQVAPQMLGTMLPTAGGNILNRLLVPENIRSQRFASAIDYLRSVLSGGGTGSTGVSAGSASGFRGGISAGQGSGSTGWGGPFFGG